MAVIITAEHFELSADMRHHLEFILATLTDSVPRISNVRLFIKRDAQRFFEATIVIHFNHEDISYSARGADLIKLVSNAKCHLFRRVIAQKEKRLDRRRRRLRTEEVA
ncbi:MAG: hypothetical protein AB7G93_21545 [Bdellovibrionales bacterium]